MTDRAAPKPKKPAKNKAIKTPGPKLVDKSIKPGIGHNSPPLTGEKNPEAIKLLDELMVFQAQKKAIAKAERDVRNRLKSEFSILASSVAREVSLRKLDADVRVQVETNHEDFKKMLGYQPSLDFQGGIATDATNKAVPSDGRNTEPTRTPALDKQQSAGFSVIDEADGDEDGVITREG